MDEIILYGKIIFEVPNKTKKHNAQSNWKRVAMVQFDGDVTEYYAWFIKKRYNLVLNKPLRGAHVTFINDSIRDFKESSDKKWEMVKNKWNKKIIPVKLKINPSFNEEYWWLKVIDDEILTSIRTELGLGEPFFSLHMTIGSPNEKNIAHHEYITNGIIRGFIN